MTVEPKTLYLVGTPIGNLGDITLRALDVLREVDVIACEDTRRTLKLLTHFGIKKPLVAVPSHDEARRAEAVAGRLAAGASVAFVTDAGMPAVSDPGTLVVRAAVQAGAAVVPIPGPSAALAALAASGLDTGRFHFLGFLPRKGADRRAVLEEAGRWPGALVLHEAPGRLARTLADLGEAWGPREAVVCRELTKLHEELARGTLPELAARFSGEVKGELTLVVAGAAAQDRPVVDLEAALEEVRAEVEAGRRLKDACREVAARTGLGARDLYQAALARGG